VQRKASALLSPEDFASYGRTIHLLARGLKQIDTVSEVLRNPLEGVQLLSNLRAVGGAYKFYSSKEYHHPIRDWRQGKPLDVPVTSSEYYRCHYCPQATSAHNFA